MTLTIFNYAENHGGNYVETREKVVFVEDLREWLEEHIKKLENIDTVQQVAMVFTTDYRVGDERAAISAYKALLALLEGEGK